MLLGDVSEPVLDVTAPRIPPADCSSVCGEAAFPRETTYDFGAGDGDITLPELPPPPDPLEDGLAADETPSGTAEPSLDRLVSIAEQTL